MNLVGEKINHFQRVRDFLISRMVLRAVLENDSLLFWRVNILANYTIVALIAATLGFGAAVILVIKQKMWALLIFDALCYVFFLSLPFLCGLSYKFRTVIYLLIAYTIGLAVIIFVGPLSAGPIWLFAFAIFAGLLLGSKAAIAAVLLNAVTLITLSWLISQGYLGQASHFFKTPQALVAALANFILLNLLAAISIATLVKGLNISNHKEKALTRDLAAKHEHLVKANQRLEIEMEERRLAAVAVRASEQKYRLLADNINDIIWLMDLKQKRLTYVSPSVERVRGFTPEETMAQSLEEILTPASRRKAIKITSSKLRKDKQVLQGGAFTLEVEIYNKDRSVRWAEITVSLIRNPENYSDMLLGVTRDITNRKQSEQEKARLEVQLRQAQKMESIGTLAGGIAHDFNNILACIIGFTELGLDDAPKGSVLSENLQEIHTAGIRAKELVKQILTFARQTDNDLKPVQMNGIIKDTLRLIRSLLPSTIQIESNIESSSLILANPTQLHQVLMNLCTNAADAMEPGGGNLDVSIKDIMVDTSRKAPVLDMKPGPYVQLTVSDTGTGISPDMLSSIFDPFFTTKEVGKGTGMGLAVVHGIVESYEGKIMVDSALNKGTVVTVYLPINKGHETLSDGKLDVMPTGGERILFVDDENAISNMSCMLLERLGYRVSTRTSSLEALELFRQNPEQFDLIITDLTMPNMTGIKLTEKILDIRPGMPIILCTGYNDKIPEKSFEALGIKALVHKPFAKLHLAKMIRKVLDDKMVQKHSRHVRVA